MLAGKFLDEAGDVIDSFYADKVDGGKVETPGITPEDWLSILTGPR